jgi:hypothetical protein
MSGRKAARLPVSFESTATLFGFVLSVGACMGLQAETGVRAAGSEAREPGKSTAAVRYEIGWATYLGGSAGEQAREIIRLPDGSLLIGGQTASADFPVTKRAVQTKYGGEPAGTGHPGLVSGDCFVTHLSADGRRLLASTYFGGSRQERNVYGMDVDSKGDIVITSLTRSSDLPVTQGAFQATNHGGPADMFAAKLSGDLAHIRWCTYVGGSDDETPRGGLALDSQDNVYVVGTTTSPDFPTTPGTLQTKIVGGRSTAIVKLKPDGSLAWSTLLGGTKHADKPHADIMGARVDNAGTIHLAGHTNATDFPVTPDAPQKTLAGQTDLFLAGLSPDGKRLLYATYWGGSKHEFAEHRPALLPDGSFVMDGFTASDDFPTSIAAYQRQLRGPGDGCVVRLAPDHKTAVFSTYLGGSGTDNLLQPTLDAAGNVWVVGYTDSRDFSVTANALQKTYGGGAHDGVVACLSPDGSRLLYATYLGGSGDDGIRGMTIGPAGEIYLVGETTSADFPVSRDAFQPKLGGGNDGFVVQLRPGKGSIPTTRGG